MTKVLLTKDYSKFKSILGNRILNSSHVKSLSQSIEKRNLLYVQPILINEEWYVIDGQHRIAACRNLKIEIPYVIVPNVTLETVRQLNSNAKAWNLRDFCESYAITGNKDYKKLLMFTDEHKLPVTTSAFLLAKDKGKYSIALREGTFQVQSEKAANQMIITVRKFAPYADKHVPKDRDFLRALELFAEKGGSIERVLKKLQETGKKIERKTDHRSYIYELLQLHNHSLGDKNILVIS